MENVLHAAGTDVKNTFYATKHQNQEQGVIVRTEKLPCKRIIFVPWKPDLLTGLSVENAVQNFVIMAMDLAARERCSKLAFPALGKPKWWRRIRFLICSGCGAFHCDAAIVAKGMLFEVDQILQSRKSTVEHISVIIEETKQEVYEIFKHQLDVQKASRCAMKNEDLPIEWTSIDGQYPLRVLLSPSSEEYCSILKALRETMSATQTQSARVERIQNPRLYRHYQLEKKYLHEELKKETERRLFHGCPNETNTLESIMKNGFDRSLAGQHYGDDIIFWKLLNNVYFNCLL